MNQETDHPIEISVHETKKVMEGAQDAVLVDCREQDEWDTAKIEGAILIPMSEITTRVSDLEPHKGKRVIVHCHLGGRSLRVTHWLRKQGFSQSQNMTGGIDAWSQEIDSSVPRY